MSDVARGRDWWQAADGRWYPPRETDQPPAPGWWLAADGKWYPPDTTDTTDTTDAVDRTDSAETAETGRPRAPGRPGAAHPDGEPAPAPSPTDPIEQIHRRDEASRADAEVLNPARARAAARALASLGDELANERAAEAHRPDRPGPVVDLASPAPAPDPSPTPRGDRRPLLEVKPSPLGVDVEHIGERLAVFDDRVELRDRNDRVRELVLGEDIADVVIQKRLSGTVLAIEVVVGPAIVLKGLRLDQAEEARETIMGSTRRVGPRGPGPTTRAGTPSNEVPELQPQPHDPAATVTRVDEADLLRKLADLHRAGVLSDDEFEAKIDLVGRIVRGEALSPTTR